MTIKLRLRIINSAIPVMIIYLLFSLLEIINIMSLYKDQVEFYAIMPPENANSKFYIDLIDKASHLTSLINFFQYSAITSLVIIILLSYQLAKLKKVNK